MWLTNYRTATLYGQVVSVLVLQNPAAVALVLRQPPVAGVVASVEEVA